MTGRERTLRALSFEPVDRTPIAGGLLQNAELLAELAGADDFWSAPRRHVFEAFRRLGCDAILGPVMPKAPDSTTRDAHQAIYDTFAEHGLETFGYGTPGHPVGLNIHDANGWKADDDLPFEPGHVLVIEPFLMKTDEGIGIRIEDGVLITENGCEVMAGPPKGIDEVKALCKRD